MTESRKSWKARKGDSDDGNVCRLAAEKEKRRDGFGAGKDERRDRDDGKLRDRD